ncbi:hypothetical protein GGX14DRAFT_481196, partial [Mycena pura]
MSPTSQSERSALNNGKRKRVSDSDDDVQDIKCALGKFLAVMRRESLLSAVDADEWDDLVSRVSNTPEPLSDRALLVPFTEASPFFGELCGPIKTLPIREDLSQATDASDAIYDDAARSLQASDLWRGVQKHVVMEKSTSYRTAIDLVLLTAVNLAQRRICESPETDDALRIRHRLVRAATNDLPTASWVAIQQDVDIPGQSGLACNGTLDYLLTIVSTDNVAHARRPGHTFLDVADVYGSAEARLGDIHSAAAALTGITVARTARSMDRDETAVQVASQGAALCVLAKRAAVINALTNGVEWRFYQISQEPDQGSAAAPSDEHNAGAGPRQKASATRSPPDPRPSSLRRAPASKPNSSPLPTASARSTPGPFTIAATRKLDIFAGRNLAAVLRLLTVSILSNPEEFGKLAS